MKFKDQLKAAAASAARVFLAAATGAYVALGKTPEELTQADLKYLAGAGVAALLATGTNWLRKGDSRYGRGATVTLPVVLKR